jgi:ABC-type uncharacterized transport system substrate-binding protein
MMNRRTFVVTAVGLLASPLATGAQPRGKMWRIGFLSPQSLSDPRTSRLFGAFREGLRELGYVEGQNIAIESRWADGKYDRLPGLAAGLVSLKLDIIVTTSLPAIQAAKQATGTIPIVMATSLANPLAERQGHRRSGVDPVSTGFLASLARPGGNITGLSAMAPELVGKQLELLKEVVPKVSRVALLGNPANPGTAPMVRRTQDTARELGIQLQRLEARSPSEIDGAFAAKSALSLGDGGPASDNVNRPFIAPVSGRRRGFKIAHGALGQRIRAQERACRRLEVRLAALPERVLVKAVMDEEEIVKFGPEAKHLTDTIKMVAYRAETALVRCLASHYARTDDTGRALIREMLSSSVDVLPDAQHLRIRLHSLANPRSNQALAPRVRDTQRARASVPGNEPDWSMKRRCCTNSCAHVRSPEFSGASWAARGRSGVYSPPSPPGRTGA